MTYAELEKLAPEAYLNPENFYTDYDRMHSPARHAEKMQEGYNTGKNAFCIFLDYRGVWSAEMRNGGYITSYEGIGYHALTSDLLAGFLASKCKLVVHRWNPEDGKGFLSTVIVNGENAVV